MGSPETHNRQGGLSNPPAFQHHSSRFPSETPGSTLLPVQDIIVPVVRITHAAVAPTATMTIKGDT
jgi:hypothetical protein